MLVPRKRTSPGGRRPAVRLACRTVPAAAMAAATVAAVAACGSGPAPAAGHTALPGSASPSSAPSNSAGSSGNVAASASGLCGAAAQVDSLTVQRANALPGNHPRFSFPATEKVRSSSGARSVAQSLCALPPVSHTVIACPADFGITYKLTFAAGSHQFAPVTLNAAGCELVHGLGPARKITTSNVVWHRLGVAIGIPHPSQAAFAGTRASS
jgi:hypothetical protein